MNKDEIKKALEFCADAFPCEGCAYHDDLMCTDKLKTDALNVIIEQEQEIEKWKNDYAKLQEQFAKYQTASDKEIAAQVKQAKIEVLNKLKEKCKFDGHTVAVYKNDIEEMIKEYENDT